ncbi:MAG: hypothetical protein EAS52_21045 [Parapedobacter sp.]|nr:MAG: hypothetical protein EAS52_21045 [Parapedobacter sp.]
MDTEGPWSRILMAKAINLNGKPLYVEVNEQNPAMASKHGWPFILSSFAKYMDNRVRIAPNRNEAKGLLN